MVIFLFVCQTIIQSFYCRFSYSSFKHDTYYPHSAMICGLISQFIWSQILRSIPNHTLTTITSVIFDSITFLIWTLSPLFFYGSSFSITGIIGIVLVIVGMILVGLQNYLT